LDKSLNLDSAGAGDTGGFLKNAGWINLRRIRAYPKLIIAFALIAILASIAYSRNPAAKNYQPLGFDFVKCAAASSLALKGHPEDAYHPASQWAAEKAAVNDPRIGFEVWDYPPSFLAMVLPFSLMPYDLALLLWTVLTLAAYLFVIRAIVKGRDAMWVAIAFPGVLINVLDGQNGLLTMSLLAGGILLLENRPLLAGLLFGLLTYKPQFSVLVPIVLIATGHWRALISAGVTVLLLVALTALLFGIPTWQAFIADLPATSHRLLVVGDVGFGKIQSVFGAARLWNLSVAASYTLQATVSLIVAVVVVWIWRQPAPFAIKGAALVTGTLMVTPYMIDYDMALLAAPIAWLTCEGLRNGFLPYEKSILFLAWIFPLFARWLSLFGGLPLTPIVLTIVMLAILRRGSTTSDVPVRPRSLARLEAV
jgi:alpha-1,2-mannosyltransferase